jgi:hypothetical protein
MNNKIMDYLLENGLLFIAWFLLDAMGGCRARDGPGSRQGRSPRPGFM